LISQQGGEADAAEDVVRLLLLGVLLEHALETEVLPDLLPGAGKDVVRDVHQHGFVSGLGEVLAHAGAHHAGADDADLPDLHRVRLPVSGWHALDLRRSGPPPPTV
jgi:hypothetical protein